MLLSWTQDEKRYKFEPPQGAPKCTEIIRRCLTNVTHWFWIFSLPIYSQQEVCLKQGSRIFPELTNTHTHTHTYTYTHTRTHARARALFQTLGKRKLRFCHLKWHKRARFAKKTPADRLIIWSRSRYGSRSAVHSDPSNCQLFRVDLNLNRILKKADKLQNCRWRVQIYILKDLSKFCFSIRMFRPKSDRF